MRLVVPPTIFELLGDPIYKTYMAQRPILPAGITHGNPWQIVAKRRKVKNKPPWANAFRPTYTDAIQLFKQLRDSGKWADIAIVSRRTYFGPPPGFEADLLYRWCGRCRRPSLFRVDDERFQSLLAAVYKQQNNTFQPLFVPDEKRCYYCGIRRTTNPLYSYTQTTHAKKKRKSA